MSSRTVVVSAGAVIALFVAGVLVASVFFNRGGDQIGRAVHAELGLFNTSQRMAPTFDLTDINGRQVSLTSLRGKVVMVEFWSSWCAECRNEARDLAEAYARWRGDDVEFIGIAIWDRPDDVMDFVERYGIEFPVVAYEGVLAAEYGVTGIPEKFFIGRDGILLKRVLGPIDIETLETIFEELV